MQILSAGERAKNTKVKKKGRKSARIVYIGHNPQAHVHALVDGLVTESDVSDNKVIAGTKSSNCSPFSLC